MEKSVRNSLNQKRKFYRELKGERKEKDNGGVIRFGSSCTPTGTRGERTNHEVSEGFGPRSKE